LKTHIIAYSNDPYKKTEKSAWIIANIDKNLIAGSFIENPSRKKETRVKQQSYEGQLRDDMIVLAKKWC
jgi:hypothetical protein